MAAPNVRLLLLGSVASLALAPHPAWCQVNANPVAAPAPAATNTDGKRIFTPEDFARFAPRNALDMVNQIPGFTIRFADQQRGLGQASENVLLNGERVSNKSGGAVAELQKIPATNVERIEIVEAATLEIAGLTGEVANVIATATKASGQFSWRPEFRPHYSDPILTRGDISYSGTRGRLDYTLALDSQGNRSAAGGPTTIFNPDGSPLEFRVDDWHFNNDSPKFSARFTLRGERSSVGNLSLSYTPYWSRYHEISKRDSVADVDRIRLTRERTPGYNYEIGGDYSFPLAGGSLKLIGLRKEGHEPYRSTSIFTFADASPATGNRFERDGRTGEWIGRAEYGWKWGRDDFLISAEAAFNTLDSVTRLSTVTPDGGFAEVRFPGGTGSVREDRYEVLGTYGHALGKTVTLQLVAGAEYSKLASASDVASLARTFLRPKGSLSLAWKADKDVDISLTIRRRVGQLNFYDFLASVNLTDNRQNAGNLSLVPPQSWEADLEFNKKLGAWGTTRLRLFGRLIEDIVDIVPIGESGQSPGNVDRATRYGVEWKSTLLFEPIGWRGAKLDATVLLQESRLKDPLTGLDRSTSAQLQHHVNLNLRHDIPNSQWAWGSGLSYTWFAKTYRLTEVSRLWEGPIWLSAFIEHKNLFGLTVRASVNNIVDARSYWDRTVYSGFRTTNPVQFIEKRNRLIGPIFNFSVRGNF